MEHEQHGAMAVYDLEQKTNMKKVGWKEIAEKDYIAKQKKRNAEKMGKKENGDEASYADIDVKGLRQLCEERELKTNGTKKALIARLEEDDEAED